MTAFNHSHDREPAPTAVADEELFALFSGPDDQIDHEADVGLARIRERLFGIREPVTIGGLELREVLGEGGMGKVYCAYAPGLQREVAVKVIRVRGRDAATQARAQERLLAEARLMAKVTHGNVVTIHDVGTEGDQVYLVMERVVGKSLREWLKDDARGWQEILRLFVGVGRGLAAVHRAGIVHSDVKPENILVKIDGAGFEAKISDFGVARLIRDEGPGGVPRSSLSYGGTPFYEAPEVARGLCDARSDVYSLVVTLFEALCGGHPYVRSFEEVLSTVGGDEDTARLAYAVEVEEGARSGVIRWTRRGKALPGWVRRALTRGLAADPAARFESMDALVAAIDVDRRRMSRAVIGGVLVAGMAVTGAGAAWVTHESALAPCRAGAERFAEVWPTSTRDALAGGGDSGAQVVTTMERYGQTWQDAYASVCVAGSIERSIPPAVHAARMMCLDERLIDVEKAAERLVLAAPEARIELVTGLRPVSLCGSAIDAVEPPSTPVMAEAAKKAHAAIAEARALEVVQDFDAAETRSGEGLRLAQESGYGPTIAAAHYQAARVILQDALRRARPDAQERVPGAIEEIRRAADRAGILRHRGLAIEATLFALRSGIRLEAGGIPVDYGWAAERNAMLDESLLSESERALQKLSEGTRYIRGSVEVARGVELTGQAIAEFKRLGDLVSAARGLRNRGDAFFSMAEDEDFKASEEQDGERMKRALALAIADYRAAIDTWTAIEGPSGRGVNAAVVKARLAGALRMDGKDDEAVALWKEVSPVLLGEGPCAGEAGNAIIEYANGVDGIADDVLLGWLRRGLECTMLPQKRVEALQISAELAKEIIADAPNRDLESEAAAWEAERRKLIAVMRGDFEVALKRARRRVEDAQRAGDLEGVRIYQALAEGLVQKSSSFAAEARENSDPIEDPSGDGGQLEGGGGNDARDGGE